jgi:hypothetical protein
MEAQEFVAALGELTATFAVQYVEMTLDGILDESEWSENVYVSKNTENDITQVIKSYIGRTGLYIGFEVTDGNVVIDKTHLEVFLNIGEELGIGNTWQFRFYTSGTVRTYVYKTPDASNWAWNEQQLEVQATIVLTETGYVVEALIPYSTLNLDAAPEGFDLLSLMCFVKAGQSSVNVYDGDTKSSNSHVININNYKPFDGNGYRG